MASSNAASESTDRSGSRWTVLPAAVLVVLLGSSLLFLVASLVGSTVAVGGAVLLSLIAAVALWRRAANPTAGTEETGSNGNAGDDRGEGDGAESNVWNTIPPWQYDGRHAESGGLTRGEQERALREIQQRADELEE